MLAGRFRCVAPPRAIRSQQALIKSKKVPKSDTFPCFYLHLFIDVRTAEPCSPRSSTGTSGPGVVRSGRRRCLVVLVASASGAGAVPPVVQQVSFERRVEHVDVQILKRGGPTLVQHLQHVGKLVALPRMVVLSRVGMGVVMVPRVRMVVGVHLVRMAAAVVRMDARMVATVVLLTRGRSSSQVVLHVLRGNVLLLLLLG